MCDSDLLSVDVENKCVLTHQSAANHDVIVILHISSEAISILFLAVEVLTGPPIQLISSPSCSRQVKANHWKREEKVLWTHRPVLLVIVEAHFVEVMLDDPLCGAIMRLICLTVPVEVHPDHGEKFVRQVDKRSAGVDEADFVLVTAADKMVVEFDTGDSDFEIGGSQHVEPSHIVFQESLLVIATHLKIASILTKTHAKHLPVDDTLLKHCFV